MGRIVLTGLAFLALAIGLLAGFELFSPGQPLPPIEEPSFQDLDLPEPLRILTCGRPSLVYFYSGVCDHCRSGLPKVAALARRCDARGVTVVGVEYGGSRDSCGRHRKEFDLPGTLLPDERGEVCGPLGVHELAVMVLDKEGTPLYRGGADDPGAVERALSLEP